MAMTAKTTTPAPSQTRVLADMVDARRRGDMATFRDLLKELPIPAETLMALKKCGDEEYIRERGLNTSLADAKYGADWLDQQD